VADIIPLQAFRFNWRKSCIKTDGTGVLVYLPAYFSRLWVLDGAQLGVVDLTRTSEPSTNSATTEPDAVYLRCLRPSTIPSVSTTTWLARRPNLLLLFTAPYRVPPVRRAAVWAGSSSSTPRYFESRFAYRTSRTTSGLSLDGVLLRAIDPAAAVHRLQQTGARQTDDPNAWLGEHRNVITDLDWWTEP
jgi:hypothetical protein